MATFYGIGVGPGDSELMTVKAVNTLKKDRHSIHAQGAQ